MKNIVTVLGQEYRIEYHYAKDDVKLKDSDGYLEPYEKKIIISQDLIDIATGKNEDEGCCNCLGIFVNKIVRHEIMHAFFTESGISYRYTREEEDFIVDWIANQFPKMKKIFEELGVDSNE